MKRLFTLCSILLLSILSAAQTSNVTATITDSGGQTWNTGSYSISYVPARGSEGFTPLVNGTPITTLFSGNMNSVGLFTASIADTNFISPAGGKWQFTICPFASATCVSTVLAVTGANPNLSSTLSALATIPKVGATPNLSRAYNDAEIIVTPGAVWIDVVAQVVKFIDGVGVVHTVGAGGGGSGTVNSGACGNFAEYNSPGTTVSPSAKFSEDCGHTTLSYQGSNLVVGNVGNGSDSSLKLMGTTSNYILANSDPTGAIFYLTGTNFSRLNINSSLANWTTFQFPGSPLGIHFIFNGDLSGAGTANGFLSTIGPSTFNNSPGGSNFIQAGDANGTTSSNGGSNTLFSGSALGGNNNGGDDNINTGNGHGSGNGGNINLSPGTGGGTGVAGGVVINNPTAPFTMPKTQGTAGQTIQWPGSGTQLIWGAAGGGTLSASGTPVNHQIAIWNSATQLKGFSTATIDDSGNALFNSIGGLGGGAFLLKCGTGGLPGIPGATLDGLFCGTDGLYASYNNDAYAKVMRDVVATIPVADLQGLLPLAQGDQADWATVFMRYSDMPTCNAIFSFQAGAPNCAGYATRVVTTSPDTLLSADKFNYLQFVPSVAGAITTENLPVPSGAFNTPFQVYIDNTTLTSGDISLVPNGTNNINGVNSVYIVPAGTWGTLVSLSATDWFFLSSRARLGGVKIKTSTYDMVDSDDGFLIIMNCSSACKARVSTAVANPYNSKWTVSVMSVGGTNASLGGSASFTYNGTANTEIPLQPFQAARIWADTPSGNTIFRVTGLPIKPGTGTSVSGAFDGVTISASGSSLPASVAACQKLDNAICTSDVDASGNPDYIVTNGAAASVKINNTITSPLHGFINGNEITLASNAACTVTVSTSAFNYIYITFLANTVVCTDIHSTVFAPVYAYVAPTAPSNGQKWFDLSTNTMKNWNNVSWVAEADLFLGVAWCTAASGVSGIAHEPFRLDPYLRFREFGGGYDFTSNTLTKVEKTSGTDTKDGNHEFTAYEFTGATGKHTVIGNGAGLQVKSQNPVLIVNTSAINLDGLGIAGSNGTTANGAAANTSVCGGTGGGGGGAGATNGGRTGGASTTWGGGTRTAGAAGGVAGTGSAGNSLISTSGTFFDSFQLVCSGAPGGVGGGDGAATGGNAGNGGGFGYIKAPSIVVDASSSTTANGSAGAAGSGGNTGGGGGGGGGIFVLRAGFIAHAGTFTANGGAGGALTGTGGAGGQGGAGLAKAERIF